MEKKPATSDMVDSSESSYGELIQKKVRFFSTQSLSEYTLDVFLLSMSDKVSTNLAWPGLERFSCFKHAYTYGLICL